MKAYFENSKEVIRELRRLRAEQTTTGNVGAFPVPIGGMLRRKFPYSAAEIIGKDKKKKNR